MYWKKGSREHDVLNTGVGISFWWGAEKPGISPTLYFEGSDLVDALCRYKRMSESSREFYSLNQIQSPEFLDLGIRPYIDGCVYDLFPAVRFPRFMRLVRSQMSEIGVDEAVAERVRLEFSKAAQDETTHGAPEDDFDYQPQGKAPTRKRAVERTPPLERRASATPAPVPASAAQQQQQQSPQPLVPPSLQRFEHAATYNLRKTAREKRAAATVAAASGPAIAARYEKTYGREGSKDVPQTVYADSQEENAADARRLVQMLVDEEDQNEVFDSERPQGKDKEEQEEPQDARSQRRAKRSKTQKVSNPPRRQRGEEEDEDDDDFDPIEFSGDDGGDDMAVAMDLQEDEPVPEVRTETAKLDEVLKIVQMTGVAMETQLKLAAFVQDRGGGAVYPDEESRRSDLKRIQEHMLELSRSLQTWTPMDRASAQQKTYTVIDDTDGTEVRMADCASELGIAWSAVSASTKRAIAELARDLHKKVYGRFPKKKRMPAGNGTMMPIYFYNRQTYIPTMKEAMTRLLLSPLPDEARANNNNNNEEAAK